MNRLDSAILATINVMLIITLLIAIFVAAMLHGISAEHEAELESCNRTAQPESDNENNRS